MKKYKEFLEELKEGLITTHDITVYNKVIINYLDSINIKNNLKVIDKLNFFLKIFNNINEQNIEMINNYIYNLGYFPSTYKVTLNNRMVNDFKNIKNIKFNNIQSIEINYEAKYSDGLYKNDIICPDKLYHLTYSDNWNSIIKKGIYPRSKKRLSVHPDRIYLFDNINDYKSLLNNLKISDGMNSIYKKYDLLEIDSSDDKFILHTDPNYRMGYFTYDNISPKLITQIYSNL
jgi:hypothetical protein